MRLTLTIPDFWPHVLRGSERIVHDVAMLMARDGNRVTVVTRGEPEVETAEMDGFRVRYRRPLPRVAGALRMTPREAFALTAAATGLTSRADVLHAFYLSDAYGLALAGRLNRRPLVFSWHGVPDAAWWQAHHPRLHHWYLRMAERADRITVMTEASAQRLREDYGREATVLMPGIFTADYQRARQLDGPPTVVCAAALDEPRKRTGLLLDAFSRVAEAEPDLHLLLVGDGDPGALRRRAAELPAAVARRVEVTRATDMPAVYARCTVGVLPSVNEAYGLSTLEYLAAGLPAVVAEQPFGVPAVTAAAGATFAADDVESCADALVRALRLAADPATEARCRERAGEFDWANRVGAYRELYRELAVSAR